MEIRYIVADEIREVVTGLKALEFELPSGWEEYIEVIDKAVKYLVRYDESLS